MSSCQASHHQPVVPAPLPETSASKKHRPATVEKSKQQQQQHDRHNGSAACSMTTCSSAALRDFLFNTSCVGDGFSATCSSTIELTATTSAPVSTSCSPSKTVPTGSSIACSRLANTTAATASSGSSAGSADSSGSPTPELLLSDEDSEPDEGVKSSKQPGAADACRCRSCRSRRAAQQVRRGLAKPTLEPEAEARLVALADWLAERDPGALYAAMEELGVRQAREIGARLCSALPDAPLSDIKREFCRVLMLTMREELQIMRRNATRQATVARLLETTHLAPLGITWVQLCEHWFQSLAYSCSDLRQVHSIMMERLKPRPEDRETPSPLKLYLELDAAMSDADNRWRQVRPQLQAWRARHCASGFGGLAEELAGTLLADPTVVQQLYKLHVAQSMSDTPVQSYTCTKCNKTLCGCYMCSFSHCVTCGFEELDAGIETHAGDGCVGRQRKRHSDVALRGSCSSDDEAEIGASACFRKESTALKQRIKANYIAAAIVSTSLNQQPTSEVIVGCCGGGSSDAADVTAGRPGVCQHQHQMFDAHYQHHHHHGHQQQHHQHSFAPTASGSSADKSADSTANNGTGNNGRFCDCCYCEVFGHSGGQQPAVPPKFFEKREQLRLKLRRKKQKPQSQQRVHGGEVSQSAATDIDALVEFIEGAKASNAKPAPPAAASAAKREAKKTRQKAAKKATEASTPTRADRSPDSRSEKPESDAKLANKNCTDHSGNANGNAGSVGRVADKRANGSPDPEEVFKPRDQIHNEGNQQTFECQTDEDSDVDPVVEQFKSFVMNSHTPKERQKVRLDINSLSLSMKK